MNFRRPARNLTIAALESLDARIVPSGLGVDPAKVAAQEALVATKGGSDLGTVYSDYLNYENSGHHGSFKTSESAAVKVSGTSVEVRVQFSGGNFQSLEKQLKNAGMKVASASAKTDVVVGFVPINKLPAAASVNREVVFMPVYKPGMSPTPSPVPFAATSAAIAPASASAASSTTAATPVATAVPTVIATPTTTTTATASPAVTPTTNAAPTSTSMPNVTSILQSVYQEYLEYVQAGSQGTFTPTESGEIMLSGTSVGVEISVTGDLAASAGYFASLGMQVTATTSVGQVGIIDGYLPIAQLPTAADALGTVSVQPIYKLTAF